MSSQFVTVLCAKEHFSCQNRACSAPRHQQNCLLWFMPTMMPGTLGVAADAAQQLEFSHGTMCWPPSRVMQKRKLPTGATLEQNTSNNFRVIIATLRFARSLGIEICRFSKLTLWTMVVVSAEVILQHQRPLLCTPLELTFKDSSLNRFKETPLQNRIIQRSTAASVFRWLVAFQKRKRTAQC